MQPYHSCRVAATGRYEKVMICSSIHWTHMCVTWTEYILTYPSQLRLSAVQLLNAIGESISNVLIWLCVSILFCLPGHPSKQGKIFNQWMEVSSMLWSKELQMNQFRCIKLKHIWNSACKICSSQVLFYVYVCIYSVVANMHWQMLSTSRLSNKP